MMLINSYIAPSNIEGLGLFAAEPIPKGTRVWELTPGLDVIVSQAQLEACPAPAQQYLRRYAYKSKTLGAWVLCCDNGKYFNHSEDPNTEGIDSTDGKINADVALRDIAAGEELTTDYGAFDEEMDFKLRGVSHIAR